MKTIPLSNLAQKDFSLSSLFAQRQAWWKEGASFRMSTPRKQNALLWFCGIEGECTMENGEILQIPLNALLYIPQGCVYTLRFFHKRPDVCPTLLLEFCLFDGEPFSLSQGIEIVDIVQNDTKIADSMRKLADDFAMPTPSLLHIKSVFYRLLHRLCMGAETDSFDSSGVRIIEPGIRYLQQDEEQSLSIEEIAKMCFVSANYFRRLFEKYAGVSPNKYRAQRKIERAKAMLENSDLTVVQISDSLNYTSVTYFCRCFKAHTGMTPIEYRQQVLEE